VSILVRYLLVFIEHASTGGTETFCGRHCVVSACSWWDQWVFVILGRLVGCMNAVCGRCSLRVCDPGERSAHNQLVGFLGASFPINPGGGCLSCADSSLSLFSEYDVTCLGKFQIFQVSRFLRCQCCIFSLLGAE